MSEKPTTSADPLKTFIRENDLQNTEAAAALGVHPTTISGWLKENRIPDYAARTLALHGEVAKARAQLEDALAGRPTRKAVVISGEPGDVDAVVGMAERLGIDTLSLSDF